MRPSTRAARDPFTTDDAPPWSWSVIVGIATGLIYLGLAPEVSGDKDASEFTLVLALNGVAHPTGYPLYTLLGHWFVSVLHAFGCGWAFAANAWSALGGGAALAFLHGLASRLVPLDTPIGRRGRFLVGLLPIGLFAFDPMWVGEATIAEVYSWHVAWVGGAALLFVSIVHRLGVSVPTAQPRLRRMALAWGFTCGLGLAHHLTSLLVIAPLSCGLIWIAHRRGMLRGSHIAAAVGMACVPLMAYGILAYRAFHPTTMQWPELAASWSSFVDHVTGAQYRAYFGHFDPSPAQQHSLALYVYPLLFPSLALSLAAVKFARDSGQRIVQGALAIATLFASAVAFSYGVPDPASYFLVPIGLGLTAIAPLLAALESGTARQRRAGRATGLALALTAAVMLIPWISAARARAQVYRNFDGLVHHMWESISFERALILWPDDMYVRLYEYQWLRGEKLGLEVENPIHFSNELPRARFHTRHGFDPFEGVAPRSDSSAPALDRLIEDLARQVNRRTSLPVILFDPKKQSMRLLRKPANSSQTE